MENQSSSSDPFRCYVGRKVNRAQRPHVVEGYEVQGHDLLFRLRPVGPGTPVHLTVLELLALLEAEEPGSA